MKYKSNLYARLSVYKINILIYMDRYRQIRRQINEYEDIKRMNYIKPKL